MLCTEKMKSTKVFGAELSLVESFVKNETKGAECSDPIFPSEIWLCKKYVPDVWGDRADALLFAGTCYTMYYKDSRKSCKTGGERYEAVSGQREAAC